MYLLKQNEVKTQNKYETIFLEETRELKKKPNISLIQSELYKKLFKKINLDTSSCKREMQLL